MARSQGSLIADEIAVVGAKVAGRIAKVHVDIGDDVKAGMELIELDREDLRLQIQQAEAQLAQARAAVGLPIEAPMESLDPMQSPPVKEAQAVLNEARTTRERMERLRRQNAVTETELQDALAAEQVAVAQLDSAINSVNEKIAIIRVRAAELALARQTFNDAVIVAPFDARILQRHIAPGTYVQEGDAIATLVRTNPLRYQGTLPERYADELRIGQEVHVTIQNSPAPCVAHVSRISPALDAATRALQFEADIDNSGGRLRAGLFAEAEVVLDKTQTALVVPSEAIVEFAGSEKVWKIVDGKSVEQVISTGARRNGLVEVQAGLSGGELILSGENAGRAAQVEVTAIKSLRPEPAAGLAENEESPPADGESNAATCAGASEACPRDP